MGEEEKGKREQVKRRHGMKVMDSSREKRKKRRLKENTGKEREVERKEQKKI